MAKSYSLDQNELTSKSTIRKSAFQIIFECIIRSTDINEIEKLRKDANQPLEKPVYDLVSGALLHKEEFEAFVLEHSKDGTLARTPKADLAILSVLLFEIRYDNLEKPVAIKEALALADDFGGTDSSGAFIQAILSKA